MTKIIWFPEHVQPGWHPPWHESPLHSSNERLMLTKRTSAIHSSEIASLRALLKALDENPLHVPVEGEAVYGSGGVKRLPSVKFAKPNLGSEGMF